MISFVIRKTRGGSRAARIKGRMREMFELNGGVNELTDEGSRASIEKLAISDLINAHTYIFRSAILIEKDRDYLEEKVEKLDFALFEANTQINSQATEIEGLKKELAEAEENYCAGGQEIVEAEELIDAALPDNGKGALKEKVEYLLKMLDDFRKIAGKHNDNAYLYNDLRLKAEAKLKAERNRYRRLRQAISGILKKINDPNEAAVGVSSGFLKWFDAKEKERKRK